MGLNKNSFEQLIKKKNVMSYNREKRKKSNTQYIFFSSCRTGIVVYISRYCGIGVIIRYCGIVVLAVLVVLAGTVVY